MTPRTKIRPRPARTGVAADLLQRQPDLRRRGAGTSRGRRRGRAGAGGGRRFGGGGGTATRSSASTPPARRGASGTGAGPRMAHEPTRRAWRSCERLRERLGSDQADALERQHERRDAHSARTISTGACQPQPSRLGERERVVQRVGDHARVQRAGVAVEQAQPEAERGQRQEVERGRRAEVHAAEQQPRDASPPAASPASCAAP